MFRTALRRSTLGVPTPRVVARPFTSSSRLGSSAERVWSPQGGPVKTAFSVGAIVALTLLAAEGVRLTRSPLALDDGSKAPSDPADWVVIDGVVYDVSKFLDIHPGGADAIIPHLGQDITALFNLLHAKGTLAKALQQLIVVRKVDPNEHIPIADTGLLETEKRRLAAPPLDNVNSLEAFEAIARTILGEDSTTWNYYYGYADSGAAHAGNSSAFEHVRFIPRVMTTISPTSTSTTFLSTSVPIPVFLSPTAQMRGGHPAGEANHTRASFATGVPQGLSNSSSLTIAEIGEERRRLEVEEGLPKVPLWWQLYLQTDRKKSEADLRAAVKAGASAILLTVDTPVLGKRGKGSKVVGQASRNTAAPVTAMQRRSEINIAWSDIAWIKTIVPGIPIIVKGVASPKDAQLAKKHGAAGVVLSNHGGRQLDYAAPPLATLIRTRREFPELLKDPKFEVYIDGGITRGTDILKALCLGARGVGIGRPFIYAQTGYGDKGIVHAIDILKEEVEIGMRLLGAQSVKDLTPDMVEILPGLVGEQQH